jgi:hypothetical protein
MQPAEFSNHGRHFAGPSFYIFRSFLVYLVISPFLFHKLVLLLNSSIVVRHFLDSHFASCVTLCSPAEARHV